MSTKYYSIPNEDDQKLRETRKINNTVSFNGQGWSGKTAQAKQFVEAKSDSDTEKYLYVLYHSG